MGAVRGGREEMHSWRCAHTGYWGTWGRYLVERHQVLERSLSVLVSWCHSTGNSDVAGMRVGMVSHR